jgi:hypothetical protein
MERLIELANRLRSIDVEKMLDEILNDLLPEIISLNKEQLWDGKTKNNADIHPFYSEDPYFKSASQARAYAGWKQRITPNSDRYFDAPNLYINGYYHSLIKGVIMDKYIEIDADGFGSGFDSKYRDIYGLTEEHLDIIRAKVLPQMQNKLRTALNI